MITKRKKDVLIVIAGFESGSEYRGYYNFLP